VIRFEKARPEDAAQLALVSGRAFDHDVHYGAPGPGGPPGYRSEHWQSKMMRQGTYYKILSDEQLIGGFVVRQKWHDHYELTRIFIDPDFQDRGIGARAIAFLEEAFAAARRWTLDTPHWNQRTRHFYRKLGYAEVWQDPHGLVYFEKAVGEEREGAGDGIP
jgi:ribosomal protein S18 acetylase RimI-like enzyme